MKRFILLLIVVLVATTNICLAQGGLNEIRFKDWSDEQWLDNDYIRELRSYIDACARGEINDETLEAHKELLDSKFCVGSIDPAIWGGAYIGFVFLDEPSKIFYAHVYGEVDEVLEEVVSYEVRYVVLSDRTFSLNKEEILQLIKEHPINKLW